MEAHIGEDPIFVRFDMLNRHIRRDDAVQVGLNGGLVIGIITCFPGDCGITDVDIPVYRIDDPGAAIIKEIHPTAIGDLLPEILLPVDDIYGPCDGEGGQQGNGAKEYQPLPRNTHKVGVKSIQDI